MIYRASHNLVVYPFFKLYTIWKIKRNFHRVFIDGEYINKDLPLLLITNHISWWDGFWVMYLNLKLFHRKFYFMMLEEQLKKYMFFNKTGGYSVRKGSKSIIETLDYTVALLHDKKNLVLMFPQGTIESIYNRTIRFEKGIEHVLRKINWQIQIFFVVNLIDYFSNPRPGLYIYFKEYLDSDYSSENLMIAFSKFHSTCIAENLLKK